MPVKVLAVQEDIVDSHPHLKEAAIPVQDLHLTLFVATLHEQDGSLQVDPSETPPLIYDLERVRD